MFTLSRKFLSGNVCNIDRLVTRFKRHELYVIVGIAVNGDSC